MKRSIKDNFNNGIITAFLHSPAGKGDRRSGGGGDLFTSKIKGNFNNGIISASGPPKRWMRKLGKSSRIESKGDK